MWLRALVMVITSRLLWAFTLHTTLGALVGAESQVSNSWVDKNHIGRTEAPKKFRKTSKVGASTLAEADRATATAQHEELVKLSKRDEDEDEVAPPPASPEELMATARKLYLEKYGWPEREAEVTAGFAPGRVNLIGEHTDYQEGFVFPLALLHGTVVFGSGRLVDVHVSDSTSDSDESKAAAGGKIVCKMSSVTSSKDEVVCKMSSAQLDKEIVFTADDTLAPDENEGGDSAWGNYIKGTCKQYLKDIPEGKQLEFRTVVVGTVPMGGGVSSSASLCVAFATFLESVLEREGIIPGINEERAVGENGEELSLAEIKHAAPALKAHRCRLAEHEFLATPCGIMDQFVSAMAKPGHALLLDCRSEKTRHFPLMDPDVCLLVTNSNIKHSLCERGSQYPVRVQQCKEAVAAIQKFEPSVETLRDATLDMVERIKADVSDVVYRRARHVVSENDRCINTAEALSAKDYSSVGRYMLGSHESLKTDFEVSCPELDILVGIAMEVDGVYGTRLTGAGFGGCTVTLVRTDAVKELTKHMHSRYKALTGVDCLSFITKAGAGAFVLPNPMEGAVRP